MTRLCGIAPAAALVAAALATSGLLCGCGSASVPESAIGSISGQIVDPGPVSVVRLRQIVVNATPSPTNSSVNIPVSADGTFTIPRAPQGPSTLEFMDARQVPYSYSELLVQPNVVNRPPQPVPGPGAVPSPDPSVNGTAGTVMPGFTGPISLTAPGTLSIRAFGPNGAALAVPATVGLYNVNIQGGPTGSVGQDLAASNPDLVNANQAGLQAAAGDGGTAGTGSTAGAGNSGGSTGTSSGVGSGAGDARSRQVPGTGTEAGDLAAQTDPLVHFQGRILAQVQTNPGGAPVTISGIPTGAPGVVTPGAISAVSSAPPGAGSLALTPGATPDITALMSTTDAVGNVVLTPIPGAAPSYNPTGGGYQLVPRPILINGQTLYARQVFLDVLPGVTTHVDLLFTPVL